MEMTDRLQQNKMGEQLGSHAKIPATLNSVVELGSPPNAQKTQKQKQKKQQPNQRLAHNTHNTQAHDRERESVS